MNTAATNATQPTTRTEALAVGLAIVDELAPRVNDRGYRDQGVVQPADRIRLALQIADWLLAGGNAPEARSLWEGAL